MHFTSSVTKVTCSVELQRMFLAIRNVRTGDLSQCTNTWLFTMHEHVTIRNARTRDYSQCDYSQCTNTWLFAMWLFAIHEHVTIRNAWTRDYSQCTNMWLFAMHEHVAIRNARTREYSQDESRYCDWFVCITLACMKSIFLLFN